MFQSLSRLSRVMPFAVSLVLLAAPLKSAYAADVYTTSASFFANVQAGSYTEAFTGGGGNTFDFQDFTGNGFSYRVTGATGSAIFTDGVYRSGTFIGNTYSNQTFTVTFTSGNVTAVGGNFFITNISDVFQAVPVTITLSDGTVVNYTPATEATYRGFTSAVPITSLTMSAPGASRYNTIDNLTVGLRLITVAPEPGALALIGCVGIVGVAGAVRRRRRG